MTAATAIRPEASLTGSLTVTFPEGAPVLNQRAATSLLKLVQDAKARLDAREALAA